MSDGGGGALNCGLGAGKLCAQLRGIERGDQLALLDGITFLDADLRHPPGQFGGDVDARRFDTAVGGRKPDRGLHRHHLGPVDISACSERKQGGDSKHCGATHVGRHMFF